MLNTEYSDYTTNDGIINGSLLNNDPNNLHLPNSGNTTNNNDSNKNYFHLCHICGNGFPKAAIPSHQKMYVIFTFYYTFYLVLVLNITNVISY
ncbi:hypothetical protein BCR36DRAFT_271680 [Piromyces finnis]|uniref:Uncharacterized protein n=1 Tax=Piromyces finnis TaxID=1754191 RepID=A0A1Y1VN68_9FUNG|nr:hypothetical protein BCR36DRAFT_271680 [Piromyces finnis]|eukprot:ORX60845.1 hypothetical protein BCR36DRAFT_271680 [Piromyces finnis]